MPNAWREAIAALQYEPLVTETALGLVEAYIQKYASTDATHVTLFTETPFVTRLDKHTLLVGISDRIAWSPEAQQVFVHSLKTTREPKGVWWSELKWLAEQQRSPQWKLEVFGVRAGVWITPAGLMRFKALPEPPPLMLRGAVKATYPEMWPTDPSDGIFTLNACQMQALVSAILAKAAAIRAMRASLELPWQAQGEHCFTYNQKCEWYNACEAGDVQDLLYTGPPNVHDERIKAAVRATQPDFGASLADVLLTPTNYMLLSSCAERWRRRLTYPTPSSQAQQIGTAFHAGCAAWYQTEMPCAKSLEPWMEPLTEKTER